MYEIYVKNTFLVFDVRDEVETESRGRPRAVSCPPSWVQCATRGEDRQANQTLKNTVAVTTVGTLDTAVCDESCTSPSSRSSTPRQSCELDFPPEVPPEVLRKINRQLTAGGSLPMIAKVLEQNLHVMNDVNLATAFHRLSRLCKGGHGTYPEATAWLPEMIRLAEEKASREMRLHDGSLSTSCCTIIAWSCGMLKTFPPRLFPMLVVLVSQSPATCEEYEVANLLWACAQYQQAMRQGRTCSPMVGKIHPEIVALVERYFAPESLERVKTTVLVSVFTSTLALLQQSERRRQILDDLRDVMRRRLGEMSELQRKLVFGRR